MNPIRRNDGFASFTETIVTSILISVFVFVAVVNQPKTDATQTNNIVPQNNVTTDVETFHFHVHCPLRNQSDGGFVELMRHLGVNDSATITNIEAELSAIETYAVFERVFTVDPNNHRSEMLMAYCGWARLLNESTCDNARFVCTIPGPMFRVAVGTETAVIWVNQINGPDFDWSYG
jgi:hypothetical protein